MPILEASTHLCRQAIASMNGLDGTGRNQPLHVYLDESEMMQWKAQGGFKGRSSFTLLPFRRSHASQGAGASALSWGSSLFSSDGDQDQPPNGTAAGAANWCVNLVHAADGQPSSVQKIHPEAVTPFESDLFTGSLNSTCLACHALQLRGIGGTHLN